jgi:agarase
LTGNSGFASLSMSIGRKHDRSKSPNIIVNGVSINVPSNWKGYDQSERNDFFGTIEIPVPIGIIQENNTVSITFDDSDGHLSSLILTVESYDSSILGIDTNQTNIKNIKLYPNPTTGKLNILNAKINSEIEIYSTSGVRVFIGKYEGFPINIEQLSDGLYFVKINNTTLKVIIKH